MSKFFFLVVPFLYNFIFIDLFIILFDFVLFCMPFKNAHKRNLNGNGSFPSDNYAGRVMKMSIGKINFRTFLTHKLKKFNRIQRKNSFTNCTVAAIAGTKTLGESVCLIA